MDSSHILIYIYCAKKKRKRICHSNCHLGRIVHEQRGALLLRLLLLWIGFVWSYYRFLLASFFSVADLTFSIGALTPEEKKDECVNHALQVAHAWCLNNYNRFFWLYQRSPKMSSYLIDWFIERERKSALKTMIKAYVLSICFLMVMKQLFRYN